MTISNDQLGLNQDPRWNEQAPDQYPELFARNSQQATLHLSPHLCYGTLRIQEAQLPTEFEPPMACKILRVPEFRGMNGAEADFTSIL
jgi:hypothetical protein